MIEWLQHLLWALGVLAISALIGIVVHAAITCLFKGAYGEKKSETEKLQEIIKKQNEQIIELLKEKKNLL